MDGVESNVVHGKDVLEAVHCPVASVTLEREVVLGVGGVNILDGHTALHTAQGEPGGSRLLVAEYGNTAVLVLQRGVNL